MCDLVGLRKVHLADLVKCRTEPGQLELSNKNNIYILYSKQNCVFTVTDGYDS